MYAIWGKNWIILFALLAFALVPQWINIVSPLAKALASPAVDSRLVHLHQDDLHLATFPVLRLRHTHKYQQHQAANVSTPRPAMT